MRIDLASPEHPYLQLAERLRERIRCGEISAKLPSLTNLTSETGLAVGTVRRAIEVLAQEQLVRRVPGRGTFVIRPGQPTLPPASVATGFPAAREAWQ